MNFNQLDIKHKRALVSHIKLFRLAVDQLCRKSSKPSEDLINGLTLEVTDFVNYLGDDEINEIVESIEDRLNATIL